MLYLGLFASAFLAATLLPFYSELAVGGLVVIGHDPLLLWLTATAGNVLGALVNWFLGRKLIAFQDRRWFPFKKRDTDRASHWFQRYGQASLLFAWLPIIGDPLTFIAGVLKVRVLPFLILVTIGKGARYAAVIVLALKA